MQSIVLAKYTDVCFPIYGNNKQ